MGERGRGRNFLLTRGVVLLLTASTVGAQVPDVGPGVCVANCSMPSMGGGGMGGMGGFSMGLQAASLFGSLLGTMMSGSGQQASAEAQRQAAERARRERIQQLKERREAVARWEAQQETVRARRAARVQAARERFLRESQEALADIEELARLGGAGFDGSRHDLGDLQVTERVGAFGTKVLVPAGTTPGGAPSGPPEPPTATMRGTGSLYSKPDAPPTITNDLPPSAEVQLTSGGNPAGGGAGVRVGPADAAPPPNPTAGGPGGGGFSSPGGQPSGGGSGVGWGQRVGEAGLGVTRAGLVEAGKALAQETARQAGRAGKMVVKGSLAGLVNVLGEWGIQLLDAANRHQDRDVTRLERGARDLPALHARLRELREKLKDPSLAPVERAGLQAEKDRLTREIVETTRFQDRFRANDAHTNAFDAAYDKRSLIEATSATALEVLGPVKRTAKWLGGSLSKRSASLLDSRAFQIADATRRKVGWSLARTKASALRKLPRLPARAVNKGVEGALRNPVEGAIEKSSGYKGLQEQARDGLGKWFEEDGLAPRQ